MGDNPNQTDLCPTPIGMIGPSGCECTVDPSNGVVVISKKNPYNTTYFVPRGSGNCCTGFAARSPRFPHNQRGRWNNTLTNTKLYPIISECKADPSCVGCVSVNPAPNAVRSVVQAGNLFRNTAARMSQRQIISMLTRNRHYINR